MILIWLFFILSFLAVSLTGTSLPNPHNEAHMAVGALVPILVFAATAWARRAR